jgi:hypothetical protein
MPAEVNTMQILSRNFTNKSKTLQSIIQWIQKEIPGQGYNYVFVTLHPRSMRFESLIKLRTAMFPRLAPDGTMAIMPILFVLN